MNFAGSVYGGSALSFPSLTYVATRYAEIDMVMANRRVQNSIKGVESDTKTIFPSDHLPVNIRLKITLSRSKNRKTKGLPSWKSPQPTCEEKATGVNNEQLKQYKTGTRSYPMAETLATRR